MPPTIDIDEAVGTITISDITPVDALSWPKRTLGVLKRLVRGQNFAVVIQGKVTEESTAAGESGGLLIQTKTSVESGLVQPNIHDLVGADVRATAIGGVQTASLFPAWVFADFRPGTDGRAAGVTSNIRNHGTAEPKIGQPKSKWAYEAFASGSGDATAAFWIRGRRRFFHGVIAASKDLVTGILEVIKRIRITPAGKVLRFAGDGITHPADLDDAKRVRPIADPLATLLELRGVEVKWKAPMNRHGGQRDWALTLDGAAAEEVRPGWVETDENGHRLVTADGWQALAVEAIREMDAEIRELKERLDALES